MPIRINRRAFQELVREAISALPDEFAAAMVNVAVVVEEEPTAEELESLGLDPELDDLFGLYQGCHCPSEAPTPPCSRTASRFTGCDPLGLRNAGGGRH